jgi:3-dehydroquinate dehydratase type I
LICVCILANNIENAIRKIRSVEKNNPDLIEIRLDYFNDFNNMKNILKSTKIPLIATNRSAGEGGSFKEDEGSRMKILLDAARSGFEYVDIELSTNDVAKIAKNLQSLGSNVIISHHDFNKTPSNNEIRKIYEEMLNIDADVCKIVTTANDYNDNLRLLSFLNENFGKSKIVCFAMGDFGKISRIFSPIFGGFFTMASLEKGQETGPGQIEIVELEEIYNRLGFNI